MKASDVFTPGGTPIITYVDEHLKDKIQQFRDILDTGTTLISISGPSKSGKTVFVERVLGRGNIIQVTGAGVNSSKDLWERVFDMIGTPSKISISSEKVSSSSFTASGEVSGSVLIAKGKGGLSGTSGKSESNQESLELHYDYLRVLIQEFHESGMAIFIDDFHYIPEQVQKELAQQIKELIRNGVLIITASTPYHSDDVIRGNPDLMGRIFSIDFDYWNSKVLEKIAELGFEQMNIQFNRKAVEYLAREAAGSPQLMQYLCLNTCFELKVRERQKESVAFDDDTEILSKICKRTSITADYGSVIACMKDGPKTRGSDRKIYITKEGWQGDTYKILLRALAFDPPQLTIRYPDLVKRITQICGKEIPSGSSITSSCQHSAAIANSAAGHVIVEWDQDKDVFDIRDPYFLFYLRWSDFVN